MNDSITEQHQIRVQQAIQHLESLRRGGVRGLPKASVIVPLAMHPEVAMRDHANAPHMHVDMTQAACAGTATMPRVHVAQGTAAIKSMSMADEGKSVMTNRDRSGETAAKAIPAELRPAALRVLAAEVASCTACSELATSRTQTVFGVGNPNARLVFFGEAPGAEEDKQGEPFVGPAGQLLTKIIEACTLRRDDVYILNVLKCRPPGNRNPSPGEAQNCRHFFEQQLEVVRPEFIVCLGAVATAALLDTTLPVGQLRGRFQDWRGIRVLVTYHPAYLLRNPSAKKLVWEDMKMLMREMKVETSTT